MRRSVAEMVGEFLREIGVLVLVFYGAASLLSTSEKARISVAIAATAVGLSSWFMGVLVERRRVR
jgi:hypothetical protein